MLREDKLSLKKNIFKYIFVILIIGIIIFAIYYFYNKDKKTENNVNTRCSRGNKGGTFQFKNWNI